MSNIIQSTTTFLNINSLISPFTSIGLGQVNFNGQTFSIIDKTGSYSLLSNPIIISSIITNNIPYSTIIDQPGGFITFQTLNNNYQILNNYPFQNQFISAGLYNLTASTLYNKIGSTVIGTSVSSIVNNLTVTNNYIQTGGLTFINNISTGNVSFNSSLTVYSSLTVSSGLTTFSSISLQSTLNVNGLSFFTSSIVATQNIFVSSSLYGKILSSQTINIQNELITNNIELIGSTLTTGVASDTNIINQLNVLSSINLGNNFNTGSLNITNNISSLSSFVVAAGKNVFVQNLISTSGYISSVNLTTLSNMSVLHAFINSSNIFTNILNINSTLTIGTILNTSTLISRNINTIGSFTGVNLFTQSFSTLSSLTTSNIISYQSTIIQGALIISTNQNQNQSQIQSQNQSLTVNNLLNTGLAQVISSINVEQTVSTNTSILGILSVGKDLITRTLMLYSSLNVVGDIIQGNNQSTIVGSNMSILGNLNVLGITTSSIILPSSLSLNVLSIIGLKIGSQLNTSSATISTLFTSSIGIGLNTTNTTVNFEIISSLQTNNYSSFYTSTLSLTIDNFNNSITKSTIFNITSSLLVNQSNQSNSFNGLDVNSLSYIGGISHVSTTISTLKVGANLMAGIHIGDGSLITNISPEQLIFSTLFVSTLSTNFIGVSTIYASTSLTTTLFRSLSTTGIPNLYIYGNANNLTSVSTVNNIIATQSGLFINSTMYITNTGVGINKSTINSNFDLEINTTLKMNPFFDFGITLQSLRANIINTSTFTNVGIVPTLISSIFFPNLVIVPPYIIPTTLSVNTIQTSVSTLIFNSTLFLKQSDKVGINILNPTFNLDVNNTLRTTSLNVSSISTNNIIIQKSTNTLWVGTGLNSPGVFSNIRYSYNGILWQQSPTNFLLNFSTTGINNVAFDGSRWTALSYSSINGSIFSKAMLTSLDGISWSATSTSNDSIISYNGSNIAFNGSMWVTVGSSLPTTSPLLYSSNGLSWTSVNLSWTGNSVSWGASKWLAVGKGTSLSNILYSLNGISWSNSSQGPTNRANDVIYDGYKWIVVGDSGGNSNTIVTSISGISNWQSVSSSNPTQLTVANSLSYNNGIYVVVGSNGTGKTIYYSYDSSNWSLGTGTLFAQNGTKVIWNGTYWLASGNDGIRQSYNGVNWLSNSVGYQFISIGLNSNQTPLINLNNSTMSLNIYENPINGITEQIVGNNMSLYASSITLNNMFIGVSTTNVIIQPYINTNSLIEQQYNRTLFVNGFTNISSFISVNTLLAPVFLNIQNV